MSAAPAPPAPLPVQSTTCSCRPDDGEYDACLGDYYLCDGCGAKADEPMPWCEPFGAGVSAHFYCQECGLEWMHEGAAVLPVPPMVERASG